MAVSLPIAAVALYSNLSSFPWNNPTAATAAAGGSGQGAGPLDEAAILKSVTRTRHAVMVDEGPMMKRFHARAKGRGTQIIKRSSHITVQVAGK